MITYSIIKKSKLEGGLRMDAEYYQPEYLEINGKIERLKFTKIKKLTEKVFSGPFGSTLKSELYQSKGIPFIRIGNISDIFIDMENLVYISENEHKRIFSTHLNPGDIVFSKIGTVGRLSVISEDLGQVNISENNIGIRLHKLSSGKRVSLLFFLLTKYGQLQILRSASGNIQQKLNVEDIENIKVPIFPEQLEQELFNLYKKIIKSRKESELLYSQAENLLLEKLGLKDFEIEDDLSYIVNLSEIKSSYRVDAEYFQPKYEKLMSKIKKKKARLGDLVSIRKGVEPGSEEYQEKGKPFIRVSNLSKFGIQKNNQKYFLEKFYQELKEDYQPEVGEILLTKDATPGVAYVVKEPIEGIISSGILRLKLKTKIEPEYLALVINSIVGQRQMERDAGGSIIIHWRPEQIKNILIPILPQSTQQKIADLVSQSHQARSKAKQLLEQAKRKVESLIEK